LPHKRFVTAVVRERAQAFLGSNRSYRASVRPQGRDLVYHDLQPSVLGQRGAALAHSTLWRWLSWLGDGLQRTFREAGRLIRDRAPRSPLHRQDWSVSPAKYHSELRRQTLERALQAVVLTTVFEELFGKAIFPNFATGWNWQ
jgi:hypothetical protein